MSVKNKKSTSFRKTNQRLIDIIIDWIVSNDEMSFYGSFLSKFQFTEMSEIQTMAVRATPSGFELIYSPEFLEEKKVEEIRYVLIHEIFHCINRHHSRSVNHDHKVINIAADVIVNYLSDHYVDVYPKLVQQPAGLIQKPDEYNGSMVYEEVYNWILEQKKKYDDSKDSVSSGSQDPPSKELQDIFDMIDNQPIIIELPDGTEGRFTGIDVHLDDLVPDDEIQSMLDNMIENIKQKNRGFIPGNVEKLLKIQKRKENPIRKLKKAATSLSYSNKSKTFRKLNRRRIPGIKGTRREGFVVNVVVDVSGSMYGEVEKAIGVILNTEVTVNIIKCDTKVQEHIVLQRSTDMKEFSYLGGGGTIIQPAIDYILNDKNLKKNGTLIITDGWTDSLNLFNLHHVIIATTNKFCPITKESRKFEQFKLEI